MASRHQSDPGPSFGSPRSAATEPSQLTLTPSNTSVSTIRKSLKSFSFPKRKSADAGHPGEDSRAPLGLHLLHAPPDPLIDFIFIHGLRGGSIKTWCKGPDLRLFWPQTWLPREADLQNVRIHSFGYNSDWGDTQETSLDVHDFGRMLFGDMSTSPQLRKGNQACPCRGTDILSGLEKANSWATQTPILLIGHSMGGLVMKKAYLLAQQDDRARDLAGRIQCMFFLATPHRGADSSKLLNNILKASALFSPKSYIADLNRGSGAISVINDEFRFHVDRLNIWSFYETIKMRLPTGSVLIVDRDSAVIGHKQEIATPLNADHRDICKFSSPSDPNYVSIRNSLVKAAEDLLGEVFVQKVEEMRSQISTLESFMHIASDPEDNLQMIEAKKTPNSCEWILGLESFVSWRDGQDEDLLCYWLSGHAGSGKSVLTTHVVRHLQTLGVDTCYYFFRNGQKALQLVSSLLRTLAFQMATLHPSVRAIFSGLRETGLVFDKDDERVIWRKIFVNGIFTVPVPTVQYWVIDGLDECIDSEKLFPMLYKLEASFPIRVFFSSRRLPSLEKPISRLDKHLLQHHISTEDTTADIQLFIENNSDVLPVEPECRPGLVEKLLRKSEGTFLWIGLTFEGLASVFSEEEIDDVLDQVPTGMEPLYDCILATMAKNTQHLKLIKAILEWTVCGTRPLSIDELQAALSLSISSKLRPGAVGKVAKELCGQLLLVDSNNMVQMIHATVREFLLGPSSDSIFTMDKGDTNQHLATMCLRYLLDDEMKPPRHPAMVSRPVSRSAFVDYACTSFSEHLAASSSLSDDIFMLLDQFFRTNVLSWIEYICSVKKNLYYLSRTSKNLQRYLERRAKHVSPLGPQYSNMQKWQVDLLRIALKFGPNLIENPSSIYFLVPPLCPRDTGIHQQFGRPANNLQLSGLSSTAWDDCICYIDYRQSRAMALAGCDDKFAIGMKSGWIKLYQQTDYQEIASLSHGEPVKLLRFDNASQNLASSGIRRLKMWSVDGSLVWAVEHGSGCQLASLRFADWDNTLVTVTKKSKIVAWSVEDGTRSLDRGGDENPNFHKSSFQMVLSADICPKAELLAIASRGRPAQIWSIEKDIMLSSCHTSWDQPGVPIMSVAQVLFSPNPVVELLAVSYQDGQLCIYDRWASGEQNEIRGVSGDALTLASTNDGRTLATGDAAGTIKFWDFETLTLLYCIKSSEHEVRQLAFSGDGFRLYDIRDTKTKVWEPSVLIRKTVTDESSISESIATPAPIIGRNKEVVDITRIMAPAEADCVFVGRDDGSVLAYDLADNLISLLYSHRRDVFVTALSWNRSMIASADVSSKIMVHALETTERGRWTARNMRWETKFVDPIRDILLHPVKPWLLILQSGSSTLVDIVSNNEHEVPIDETDNYRSWTWLPRPSGPILLLGARGYAIDAYTVDQIRVGHRPFTWRPSNEGTAKLREIKSVATDKRGRYIAVCLNTTLRNPEEAKLLVYKAPSFFPGEGMPDRCIFSLPSREVKTFLGFHNDCIVFLDHSLWIRSMDVSRVQADSSGSVALVEQHFFIPREFIGSSNGVDGTVAGNGNVVFPKEGELAIVKNAFAWSFKAAETRAPRRF